MYFEDNMIFDFNKYNKLDKTASIIYKILESLVEI